ncbi:MAG: serine/threonine-protein kinase, partial [Myxococcota bacterium]|nr:serine/threonine-protein kinase [Myxococcota bacterium]
MTKQGPKRGPYTLLHKLGEGGMGTVWLARHGSSGALAALKTLSTPDARLLHRFRREIRLLRHLDHPGVVELLDEGVEADGTPWYVMRLLKGKPLLWHLREIAEEVGDARPLQPHEQPPSKPSTHILTDHWTSRLAEIDTLAQVPPTQEVLTSRAPTPKFEGYTSRASSSLGFATTLAAILAASESEPPRGGELRVEEDEKPPEGGRLGWGERQIDEPLRWLRQLCETLAHVHGEGIVHCDLKPENIVITEDGDAILVDFGIAERFGARVSHEVLEAAGVQAGTPHYISPEQIRGEPVDARTDLYALGCILYEILIGKPPFEDGSATSI